MARLPTVGGDTGNWGEILNDFLSQSLDTGGALKSTAVSTAGAQMTSEKGAADGYASLDAGGKVPSAQVPDPAGATTLARGVIQLAGDLGGTADAPTVPGLAGKVDTSRTITAGTGLSGGGDLSANRTLSVTNDSTTQKMRVAEGGSLVGTRQEINFVEGSGVTITTADDTVNNRVNVTLASSGAVSSVNGETGDVTLDADDVGAAVASTAPAVIRYNTGTSSYPARSTVTSDGTRTVIWIGPTAPSIGSGGAVNDIDVWWKTP